MSDEDPMYLAKLPLEQRLPEQIRRIAESVESTRTFSRQQRREWSLGLRSAEMMARKLADEGEQQ